MLKQILKERYYVILAVALLFISKTGLFGFSKDDFWSEWKNEKAKDWQIMKAINNEKMVQTQNSAVGIDVFGYRFRNEKYILQPRPDQMRGLVLTYRQESLNWGELLLTFNKNVDIGGYDFRHGHYDDPIHNLIENWRDDKADCSILRYIYTIPECYVIEAIGTVSNGTDYIQEINSGGYIDTLFSDKYDCQYTKLKFNEYTRVVNGVKKLGYISTPGKEDVNWTIFAGGGYTVSGGGLPIPTETADILETNTQLYEMQYADGTFERIETYCCGRKDYVETGGPSPNNIVFWFRQIVFTATEFNGRKIDYIPHCYYPIEINDENINVFHFEYNLPGMDGLNQQWPYIAFPEPGWWYQSKHKSIVARRQDGYKTN